MIRATMETAGDRRRLRLSGHATGEPAVCAAASSMLFALAGWLQERRAGELAFRLAPGDGWVECGRDPLTDAAFGVVATAFRQLERSYPQQLRMYHGVNGPGTEDIYRLQGGDTLKRAERRTL